MCVNALDSVFYLNYRALATKQYKLKFVIKFEMLFKCRNFFHYLGINKISMTNGSFEHMLLAASLVHLKIRNRLTTEKVGKLIKISYTKSPSGCEKARPLHIQ